MVTVTFEQLRRRLRDYVRLAEAGQSVAIVRDGITIAELCAPQDQIARDAVYKAPPAEGGLQEAPSPYYALPRAHEHLSAQEQPEGWEERGVREGWLRLPTSDEKTPPPRAPIKGLTFEQLMLDLERDREDR